MCVCLRVLLFVDVYVFFLLDVLLFVCFMRVCVCCVILCCVNTFVRVCVVCLLLCWLFACVFVYDCLCQ